MGSREHKISLYADDIVLYLTSVPTSLRVAQSVFLTFARLSGLQVNFNKSEIYTIFLSPQMHTQLSDFAKFKWTKLMWRYLGVNFPLHLGELKKANFDPILHSIRDSCRSRNKLLLSWPDRLQIIKFFVLPKFLFLFRVLPIAIKDKELQLWQIFPDLTSYYKASQIAMFFSHL